MADNEEPTTTTLAETENYAAYTAVELDGETTYHVELDKVTLHFFREEFEEFLRLIRAVKT
jgi:predicted secreted protein